MDYANRAEQAVDGLDVTAAGGVVLVEDGHSRWLCPETAYDAAYAAMAKLKALPDEDGEGSVSAHDELCSRIWRSGVVATQGGEGHQGPEAERHALIRQALEADLIDEDTARRMGLPLASGHSETSSAPAVMKEQPRLAPNEDQCGHRWVTGGHHQGAYICAGCGVGYQDARATEPCGAAFEDDRPDGLEKRCGEATGSNQAEVDVCDLARGHLGPHAGSDPVLDLERVYICAGSKEEKPEFKFTPLPHHLTSCYEQSEGGINEKTFWVCGPDCPTMWFRRMEQRAANAEAEARGLREDLRRLNAAYDDLELRRRRAQEAYDAENEQSRELRRLLRAAERKLAEGT